MPRSPRLPGDGLEQASDLPPTPKTSCMIAKTPPCDLTKGSEGEIAVLGPPISPSRALDQVGRASPFFTRSRVSKTPRIHPVSGLILPNNVVRITFFCLSSAYRLPRRRCFRATSFHRLQMEMREIKQPKIRYRVCTSAGTATRFRAPHGALATPASGPASNRRQMPQQSVGH